ncbi:Lrp/AsnC family transcriptional regulator [Pedobacter arcticus]|uniref:Lrp/AsnC family transcriptional regulator n=1 Tax=Pedobacter arcticus TaxID=752140 RepID=UPI0002E34B4E|nr:Lrp/AsnC family transcriptional regulator [Pedobacter arcticus]
MIDNTDIKILRLLQENAHLTFKEISQKINLSVTPVHDRIKRMERDGVIEKYITLINKNVVNANLTIFCNITLDKQTKFNFSDFEESILKFPEIVECNVVSGGYDYLLKVVSKDMETYNTFYQHKLSVLPTVAHIHSVFVMAEIKKTTLLPI